MDKEKIKEHFRKHKTKYAFVAGALVSAGITCLVMRRVDSERIGRGIPVTAERGIPVFADRSVLNIASHCENVVMNNVSVISSRRKGGPSWVVRCIETGQIFSSQLSAAEELGIPASELSRHLNGKLDHVRELHFERICMAA